MRNLLNFLLKYNHWFLFVLLEVISLTLLFRFNNYQGSAFFTSANYLAGIVYEASGQVTRYFGLTEVNKDLTTRNVELEIEVERLSQALEQYTQDTTGVANLRKSTGRATAPCCRETTTTRTGTTTARSTTMTSARWDTGRICPT